MRQGSAQSILSEDGQRIFEVSLTSPSCTCDVNVNKIENISNRLQKVRRRQHHADVIDIDRGTVLPVSQSFGGRAGRESNQEPAPL